MRNQDEIQALIKELKNTVDVDNLEEYDRVANERDFNFLCDVLDTLSWVLGEIDTEDFKSEAYLNLDELKKKAKRG